MGPSSLLPSIQTSRLGPWGVLMLAAWFGLVAGLMEVLTKVLCTAVGRSGRLYQMSRHFFWLIPVTNLLVFLGLGLFLAILVWVMPRFGRWLSVRWFGALAMLPSLLVAVPEVYLAAWLVLAWGVAVRFTPLIERHSRGFRRLVVVSYPLLMGAVVGLGGWVLGGDWVKQARESTRPLPSPGSPNVLLVVLDTVRADRLSVYGYKRKTTPTLERLVAEGVRFDAARSTSPWSLPSHGSMFTGRLPHELKAEWVAPLGTSFPTLAGYLGSRGYATAGFVANTLYCGYDTGLAEGFTHYEDYNLQQMDAFLMARLTERALLGYFQLSAWIHTRFQSNALASVDSFIETYVYNGKRKDATMINRDFFRWLSQRREPERPFFVFLNYFDTHDAYLPPRWTDFRFGLRPTNPSDFAVLQNWESIDKPSLHEHYKTLASDCYDDCIRYVDEQLHLLFSNMAKQGLLERTLVIVTADHGESFGEHDLYVHGDSLYRAEIRVPLLMMLPWAQPARKAVESTVSLRDLPATVVDLLDLEQGSPFPGRSLAWTWDGQSRAESEPAVSELASPNPSNPNQGRSPARSGKMTSLALSGYTYITNHEKEELFDETRDPGEQHNLAGDHSTVSLLERFRSEMEQVVQPGHPR